MAVDEVGTGVGYVETSSQGSRANRLIGRGSGGDEDGSKGGSRDADRFREDSMVKWPRVCIHKP